MIRALVLRPRGALIALLAAVAAGTTGCGGKAFSRESAYVTAMRHHERLRQHDRTDYEAELQESRRQQDDRAAHSSARR